MLYGHGMTSDWRSQVVQVRCSAEEKQAWQEAADIRKVSLSEWMRRVLSATAEKTKGEGL